MTTIRQTNYVERLLKVIIICNQHGEFLQTPAKHLLKRGCPKCCHSFKKTIKSFTKKANEIHNYKYDYSKTIYLNCKKQIIITCLIHGDFKTTPDYHLNANSGCIKCSKDLFEKTKKELKKQDFIEKAKIKYKDDFDYSNIDYVGNLVKINIICNICKKTFLQTPSYHLKGKGCLYCNGFLLCESNSLGSKFPDLAKEWHPIKNGTLTPFDVSYGSDKKFWWFCKNGHSYFSSINGRTSKQQRGCKKCKTSKGERKIYEYLDKTNIKYKPQGRFKDCKNRRELPFDCVIFNKEDKPVCCIEFQGGQHFRSVRRFGGDIGFEKRKINDNIKKQWCLKNNIFLLEISFEELYNNNIDNILEIYKD